MRLRQSLRLSSALVPILSGFLALPGLAAANNEGSWALLGSASSVGGRSFPAMNIADGAQAPPTPTEGGATETEITSFSGANDSTIMIGGIRAAVENADQSWSLTKPNSSTLRFEVQPGDHFIGFSWNDVTMDGGAERSEIEMFTHYPPDTQINISYGFTLEPGATNTASWMVLGQIHGLTGGNPPFAVAMYGEHMTIIARGPSNAENDVYKDPNPIQRGHQYQMNIQTTFGSDGNGTLKVWRDGVEIVNYTGPLGGGSGDYYYWKEGIYRAPGATNTIAADYSNLQITTGSASPQQIILSHT